METSCRCACCQKAEEDKKVEWVRGYQFGYGQALLEQLEETLTQTEPVERKQAVRVN